MNIDIDTFIGKQPVDFSDYDICKDRIVCCVVNRKKNQEILENIPHIDFLDLAVVFRYVFDTTDVFTNKNTVASMTVNNEMVNAWHVSSQDIYDDTATNQSWLHAINFQNLETFMQSIPLTTIGFVPSGDCPVHIVTNNRSWYGAALMLDKYVMKDIADYFNCNYFIIPSSIHEILVIPESSDINAKELAKIVKDVNCQVDEDGIKIVSEDVFLSNNVYLYDRGTEKISIA